MNKNFEPDKGIEVGTLIIALSPMALVILLVLKACQ
jgi:hypothetical protein